MGPGYYKRRFHNGRSLRAQISAQARCGMRSGRRGAHSREFQPVPPDDLCRRLLESACTDIRGAPRSSALAAFLQHSSSIPSAFPATVIPCTTSCRSARRGAKIYGGRAKEHHMRSLGDRWC